MDEFDGGETLVGTGNGVGGGTRVALAGVIS